VSLVAAPAVVGEVLRPVQVELGAGSRTYGFLRSLNLTGAPIHGLIDCIAVNVFR
jgi:hypothetical protein